MGMMMETHGQGVLEKNSFLECRSHGSFHIAFTLVQVKGKNSRLVEGMDLWLELEKEYEGGVWRWRRSLEMNYNVNKVNKVNLCN